MIRVHQHRTACSEHVTHRFPATIQENQGIASNLNVTGINPRDHNRFMVLDCEGAVFNRRKGSLKETSLVISEVSFAVFDRTTLVYAFSARVSYNLFVLDDMQSVNKQIEFLSSKPQFQNTFRENMQFDNRFTNEKARALVFSAIKKYGCTMVGAKGPTMEEMWLFHPEACNGRYVLAGSIVPKHIVELARYGVPKFDTIPTAEKVNIIKRFLPIIRSQRTYINFGKKGVTKWTVFDVAKLPEYINQHYSIFEVIIFGAIYSAKNLAS